jgi:hypothetical protein
LIPRHGHVRRGPLGWRHVWVGRQHPIGRTARGSGIRYLDQGSRGAGEGTHNYVVFDPGIIEILRKYGLGGLIAGTGAAGLGTAQNY